MMKRTVFTLLAAAAISVPTLVAPALLTPAAAQVVFAPHAGYGWNAGYRHWEGDHRFWAPSRWRAERRFEHFGWHGRRW